MYKQLNFLINLFINKTFLTMRKFLVSLLLMALMIPFAAKADVIIGDGTNSSNSVPFDAYYYNSWQESVYLAEEIGGPCVINSIAWYCDYASSVNCSDLRIYMGEVEKEGFASDSNEWTPAEDLVLVYSHSVTIATSTGWQVFTLDTPFYYDGNDNLAIAVGRKSSGYSSSQLWRYTYHVARTNTRHDDSDPSVAQHPGLIDGSTTGKVPNIKLGTSAYTPTGCIKPISAMQTRGTVSSATISWVPFPGTNNFDVYVSLDGTVPGRNTTPTASNVTGTTYTFYNLNPSSGYMAYVRASQNGQHSAWRSVSVATRLDIAGEGTALNPYMLRTVEDLNTLDAAVTANYPTQGKHFLLLNDIDGLASPIGDTDHWFQGEFDGNGKTLNVDIVSYDQNTGVFTKLGPGAYIHDLTVTGSLKGYAKNTGGIVGDVDATETFDFSPIIIDNCVCNLSTLIGGNTYTGGILGCQDAGSGVEHIIHTPIIVSNCVNYAYVNAAGYNYAGGIVGQLGGRGEIHNCVNYGGVNGKNYVGGITGYTRYYGVVTNCGNHGAITGTGTTGRIAGVVGWQRGGMTNNCYNVGDVTGPARCGGVCGHVQADNTTDAYVTLCNNYNAGTVSGQAALFGEVAIADASGIYTEANYYKAGSHSTPYVSTGTYGFASYANYLTSFTQNETTCTLAAAGFGGSTNMLTALNAWRDQDGAAYNMWYEDTYMNNAGLPWFKEPVESGLLIEPSPVAMGDRPIGAWMHPVEVALYNNSGEIITINGIDFENGNFYVNENGFTQPFTMNPYERVILNIGHDINATPEAGEVTDNMAVDYGNRIAIITSITVIRSAAFFDRTLSS